MENLKPSMKNLFDRLKKEAGLFSKYETYEKWCVAKKYPHLKKQASLKASEVKK